MPTKRNSTGSLSLREVKTEYLSEKEVIDFFVPPAKDMGIITETKNTFIVGHKGSGKSMILRYLSLPLQIDRIKQGQPIDFDKRAIGIFIRCDIGKFGGMTHSDTKIEFNSPWVRHFTHSFNLSLLHELLKSLSIIRGSNSYNLEEREVTDFLQQILKLLRLQVDSITLDAVMKKIDDEISLLQEEYQENRIASTQRYYTDHRLLYHVRSALHESSKALKIIEPVFLLDEYTELSANQQRIVNEMIKIRQPVFKMSTLPYGFVSSRILDGSEIDIDQDFDLVHLASNALTPNSSEFVLAKQFLKDVCNRRIHSVLGVRDVEDILESPRPYVKNEKKRTKADIRTINEFNYCGFSNYVLLSSGNPKTMLDLIQDTLNRAVEKKINLRNACASTRLQLESVNELSKRRRNSIVSAGSKYGRSLQRLIESVGKKLKSKSDETGRHYRLLSMKNEERLTDFAYETIVLGLKKSLLIQPDFERVSRNEKIRFQTLTLDNLLLPSFELSFSSQQVWEVSAQDVETLISSEATDDIQNSAIVPVNNRNISNESPSMDVFAYKDTLKELIKNDKLVIFCGAGLSNHAGYPTAQQLKNNLAVTLKIDPSSITLDKVAEAYANYFGEPALYSFISDAFGSIKRPNIELHNRIAELGVSKIITTNWDDLLETAFKNLGKPYAIVVTKPQLGTYDERKTGIFKIHGDLHNLDYLVVTKKQYIHYDKTHESMLVKVRALLQNRSVLFLGYSMDDPDVRLLTENVFEDICLEQVSYAVFRNIQDSDRLRLERNRINVIKSDLPLFINSLADK